MSDNNDFPMALAMWVKRDQEERRIFKEKMAVKNAVDDKQYMRFMSFLVQEWKLLNRKEKELLVAFAKWNELGRNFTPSQRSAIGGMYAKYILDKKEMKFG